MLEDVEATESKPLNVRVVGEQFAWTFFYERDGKEVATRQLHVPINRQVKFTLQAKDVLHDFWVPAFRMKKDAVPGIDVTYTVIAEPARRVPDRLRRALRARTRRDALDRRRAARPGVRPLARRRRQGPGGRRRRRRCRGAADGKSIFTSQEANCAACHTLGDAGTKGTIGPDLDTVLADKDEAFIKDSITTPDKVIADGYQSGIMPGNFADTLPPAQLAALVKYLSEVTKGG